MDGQAAFNMEYVFRIYRQVRDDLPRLAAPSHKDHADAAIITHVENQESEIERLRAELAEARADIGDLQDALTVATEGESEARRLLDEARKQVPVGWVMDNGRWSREQPSGLDSLVVSTMPVFAAATVPAQPAVPAISVVYGPMPESNGKSNFTAILCRDGNVMDGFTIARSEYPDRVRYEADLVRHIIGELPERPCLLDYDCDKHSGYKEPQPAVPDDVAKDAVAWLCGNYRVVTMRKRTVDEWLKRGYSVFPLTAASGKLKAILSATDAEGRKDD